MKTLILGLGLLTSMTLFATEYDWYTAIVVANQDECLNIQREQLEQVTVPDYIDNIKVIYKDAILPTVERDEATLIVSPGYIAGSKTCIVADDLSSFFEE